MSTPIAKLPPAHVKLTPKLRRKRAKERSVERKPRTFRLQIYTDEKLGGAFERVADARDVSVSDLGEEAIRFYLEHLYLELTKPG